MSGFVLSTSSRSPEFQAREVQIPTPKNARDWTWDLCMQTKCCPTELWLFHNHCSVHNRTWTGSDSPGAEAGKILSLPRDAAGWTFSVQNNLFTTELCPWAKRGCSFSVQWRGTYSLSSAELLFPPWTSREAAATYSLSEDGNRAPWPSVGWYNLGHSLSIDTKN